MLRPMRGVPIGMALLALAACTVPGALAEEPEPPPEESEALIERILELRGEMEALLEGLSPELRAEVERRWRERAVETGHEAPAADSGTAPATSAPPEPVLAEPEPAGQEPSESEPVEPEPIEPEPIEPGLVESELPPPAPESGAAPGTTRLPKLTRQPAAERPACGSLHLLDRNDDGLVDGSDRDWRYLYLSLGGRGAVEEGALRREDVESLYEMGVRSLAVDLREWGGENKTFGDVVADRTVRLLLTGKRKGHDSGALAVDAGRLARSGEIRLVDTATGEALSGIRLFRPGVALETVTGERIAVPCP